jgi:hypothetical protein
MFSLLNPSPTSSFALFALNSSSRSIFSSSNSSSSFVEDHWSKFFEDPNKAEKTKSAIPIAALEHPSKSPAAVLGRDAARQSCLDGEHPVLTSPFSLPVKGVESFGIGAAILVNYYSGFHSNFREVVFQPKLDFQVSDHFQDHPLFWCDLSSPLINKDETRPEVTQVGYARHTDESDQIKFYYKEVMPPTWTIRPLIKFADSSRSIQLERPTCPTHSMIIPADFFRSVQLEVPTFLPCLSDVKSVYSRSSRHRDLDEFPTCPSQFSDVSSLPLFPIFTLDPIKRPLLAARLQHPCLLGGPPTFPAIELRSEFDRLRLSRATRSTFSHDDEPRLATVTSNRRRSTPSA